MAKKSNGGIVSEADKKPITKERAAKALRIFRYILPYKWKFITGMGFLALSSLTVLAFPYVTGQLVDSVTGTAAKFSRNEIAEGLIAILVLQAFFSYFRVWLFSQVTENAMRDVRLDLYGRIITLPMSFYEQRRVGELQSRLTSDVSQLQDSLGFTLAEFFRQIITLIVGIGIIMVTSTQLTLVMLACFPPIIIGAILFGKFIRKLSKKASDELAAANVVAEETMQAIAAVKSFTNEFYEKNRFNQALNKVVDNALKAAAYRGGFISFVIFGIFGSIVVVLWYGLGLVADGDITIGKLVSFIIYTTFIGGAAGGLGDLYGQLQKTIGASERVVEILDETPETKLQEIKPLAIAGEISFKNVRFRYPTRPDIEVLKGLNLHIHKGEKVALVGHSGAGKSTIIQLIQRFYSLSEGNIVIDNQAIESFDISELRKNIGLVPQEVILFGGSIKENIAYGKPNATDEEIIEAAKKANAWQFIAQFPEKLDTLVGERGVKLSGGQRQRIAIARAILKNPCILILDEATSSLDSESEALVQEALDTLMEGRTTIIIAHRLATIRKAERIYVLNQGEIEASGNHNELMEVEEGTYARLVKLQFENQLEA